jgi:DNA-binding NarL/FixJ family response regulator
MLHLEFSGRIPPIPCRWPSPKWAGVKDQGQMSIASYPIADGRGTGRAATPPRPARAATHALIIHQAEIVRLGVSAMLSSGSACEVAAASSVYEAFRVASDLHPQVVLFDFTPAEGPEVCRLLSALWPRPRLIAMVTRGREVAPGDCLSVGADAAVMIDNVNRDTFLVVVRRVMDGYGPLVAGFPTVGERLPVAQVDEGPVSLLTPREREMLYLIGQGLSNREIAESLVLSVKTVEAHRANLSRKLNVRSRAGLMRLALTGSLA